MPMVTLVKTLDVSRLVKVCKRSGMKFTMLMCWCVGKAAGQVEANPAEFSDSRLNLAFSTNRIT